MDSTDSSQSNSTPVQNSANLKEQLSSYSDEKLYEYFAQTAWNLREVVDSFEVIKERYGLTKKQGLELYRGLRATLGCQGAKTWKARDVLNMLEKRANQKEYAQQVSREGGRRGGREGGGEGEREEGRERGRRGGREGGGEGEREEGRERGRRGGREGGGEGEREEGRERGRRGGREGGGEGGREGGGEGGREEGRERGREREGGREEGGGREGGNRMRERLRRCGKKREEKGSALEGIK